MQPKKKTRKMRHTSNRFILHSARERVTENRSKFQWALPGATLCQMKGQVNYITTVLRPVMVTGQTQPADGRRRKTTGSRPTVAKITTQFQAGGEKKNRNRRHDRFASHVRKRGEINQWLVRWSKWPTQQRVSSHGPKTGQDEKRTKGTKA